jgi:hypothetical protein
MCDDETVQPSRRGRKPFDVERVQWDALDAKAQHELIERAQWRHIALCMQSRGDPSFTGTIFLVDLDGCHSKRACESAPPMPLTRRNRERLEQLGFKISDDGCWAIWQESLVDDM